MKLMRLNFLLLLFLPILAIGQSFTVETCQEKAKANYPLLKQYGLIEQTAKYNIANANKGYLPQLNLSAKSTYQSDVTQIPTELGGRLGITIPEVSKAQYQAVLEASQTIWDGGIISSQNKITQAYMELEKQKLEVDLYTLNDRINQLFFGIILLNEQYAQNEILKKDLQTNLDKLTAYKQNGIAQQSDLDLIRVELLNTNQRSSDLINMRKTYCILLSTLTKLDINEKTELRKPKVDLSVLNDSTTLRPEIKLFEAQNKLFDYQKNLILSGNSPKIAAFAQGGYGQPGMNMFASGFSPFYIGGVRLSWNISSLYSQKNNLGKLDLNKRNIDIQKETFIFNNNLATKQQQNEIIKIQSTITNDMEIIRLRENIRKATSSKLENGTASVSDLIRDLNAENQSRQQKSLHEIQLMMSVYQLKNNTNH